MPYTTQGYMTAADMADLADLHDWHADESDPECEARGCDIPPGYSECRRCGAEVDECGCCQSGLGPEAIAEDECGDCGHAVRDHAS